jgi:hypothetical protein
MLTFLAMSAILATAVVIWKPDVGSRVSLSNLYHYLTSVGGSGGDYWSKICPPGQFVVSMYGKAGDLLDGIGFTCSSGLDLGYTGGWGSDSYKNYCPNFFTGVQIHWGSLVGKVTPYCPGYGLQTAQGRAKYGGSNDYVQNFWCPGEQYIVGATGRSGRYVDKIQFICDCK